ncbi:hypothetical protein HanIR_Chr15g0763201 [Helianthus annuus]|nr:hypothetical protein HanIR_Chr15g0763201 [Helianthus annuus]
MIRVRNFEYTFRALGIEPIVGDFRRLYQLFVSMGFFSFRQREGTPKLMVPPKGMTKWKTKFFYVKLWVLRMMLGRLSRKARPVLREKNGEEALLWRMFCPDFKGEIEVVACADDEEGFNRTIRDNFRLPERDTPEAELPQGKGILIYSSFIVFRQLVFDDCFWVETHRRSGGPAAAGVPKQPVQQIGDQRFRKPKKPHEPVVVPPLVPKVAGGVAATGGSSAGT